MDKFYAFTSRIIFLFILTYTPRAIAQLSPFTLAVSPIAETCTGNGGLSFTVSGTVAGATIVYAIYALPDTVNAVTTSANFYGGLTSGDYLVIATQSLNGQSSAQQQTVAVEDNIENLAYAVTDGMQYPGPCVPSVLTLEVNVLQGNAVSYEIMEGPVLFPPQPSNVFVGVVSGSYQVRVYDACGEAKVQAFTFTAVPITPGIASNSSTNLIDCETYTVSEQIITNIPLPAYPVEISYTLYPPSGPPETINVTITSGIVDGYVISQPSILTAGLDYTSEITITDGCGNTFNNTSELGFSSPAPNVSPGAQTCTTVAYIVTEALSATITVAPDTYEFDLPQVLPANQAGNFITGNLLPGEYTILATDECGTEHEITFEVTPPQSSSPDVYLSKGCEPGTGALMINTSGSVTSAFITEAPAAFEEILPYDVSAYVSGSGTFMLSDLPDGDYVFAIANECNDEFILEASLDAFAYDVDVSLEVNCGSFNILLNYTDNSTAETPLFYIQKLDPVSGQWGHPLSEVPYVEGTMPTTATGYPLLSNTMVNNLLFTGQLRILSYRAVVSADPTDSDCNTPLYEFDINTVPVISDTYSFSCDEQTYEVVVNASGVAPLQYRITMMNGDSFIVENGESNIFSGLAPGTYIFQVEDDCGNIANREYEINEPYIFAIAASLFCEGQPGTLSVAYFDTLQYSWWKDDPQDIISTSGTVGFPAISEADFGTYFVHVFSGNPESCVDFTIEYEVNEFAQIADAGDDNSISICAPGNDIDLYTLLGGSYVSGGVWSANAGSGTLSGSLWNTAAVPNGTYVFTYLVNGCSGDDQSQVSITLISPPETPQAFIEQEPCELGDLQLLSTFVGDVTYQWTGPNGFTSTQPNPVIQNVTVANSGTYTLQAISTNCTSGTSSITVNIQSMQEVAVTGGCKDERMLLTATAIDDTGFTYEWSGPSNFSAQGNPVDITGNPPGEYAVVATNPAGCVVSASADIGGTACTVPAGISLNEDGLNDTFDLSGLGRIKNVKIFSRYGRVVFEQGEYVDQWHGQDLNGSPLPSATYYYYLQTAAGEEKTGWVYLLRN